VVRPVFRTEKDQIRGIRAREAVARVSELGVGQNVFTTGFADPNFWSNSAVTTEMGMNWYWNEHLKFYNFWPHGTFAEAVFVHPGDYQKSADMFGL
jgi:phosphate-selective porin OprO/OprP